MNVGRCTGCGQPIVWIVTTKGKKMPCDPQRVHAYGYHSREKKDKIVTASGRVVSCNLQNDGGPILDVGYVPHWATCPAVQSFKKEKEK